MRIALLCGDQPRHLFLAERLAQAGYLAGIVVQTRTKLPPGLQDLPKSLTQLVDRHFLLRDQAEFELFGSPQFKEHKHLSVDRETLNSAEASSFLKSLRPDLIIVWGTNLLKDEFIAAHNAPFWNLHGGLSPRYKGAATLFWPSYMLEPQMTGITIHEPTSRIDGGPILHQSLAPLVMGDGLQKLAARAVWAGIDDAIQLLSEVERGHWPAKTSQTGTGKLWAGSDWRPEHLRLIYETYEDQIVDRYLEGSLTKSEPEIIRGLSL